MMHPNYESCTTAHQPLCQGYGIKKLGGKVSNFLPFMPFGAFYSSVIKTNAALSIKVIIINDLKSFANLATSRSNLRQSRFWESFQGSIRSETDREGKTEEERVRQSEREKEKERVARSNLIVSVPFLSLRQWSAGWQYLRIWPSSPNGLINRLAFASNFFCPHFCNRRRFFTWLFKL